MMWSLTQGKVCFPYSVFINACWRRINVTRGTLLHLTDFLDVITAVVQIDFAKCVVWNGPLIPWNVDQNVKTCKMQVWLGFFGFGCFLGLGGVFVFVCLHGILDPYSYIFSVYVLECFIKQCDPALLLHRHLLVRNKLWTKCAADANVQSCCPWKKKTNVKLLMTWVLGSNSASVMNQ